MDDFLVSLYAEEQEKIAAADMGAFMKTLPVDELEDFLGLTKLAVAGPTEPPLPNSEGGKLDKDQKKADAEVRGKDAKDIEKDSQGIGDDGMGNAGMAGGVGGGMETTASVKADIVRRVMNVTSGAPPHIKSAASQFAGLELAKVKAIDKEQQKTAASEEPSEFSVKPGYFAGKRARGRAMRGGNAILPSGEYVKSKIKGELKGGAKGGAIGAGLGALAGGGASLLSRGKIPLREALTTGALAGGGTGLGIGALVGSGQAHRKFMEGKGIKERFLVGNRMTPEGAKNYLTEPERAKAKMAASEEDKKYSVKPGGWLSGRKAMFRALSREYSNNPESLAAQTTANLKGWAGGTGVGAGLGAGLGAGASLLSRGKIPMKEGLALGAAGGGLLGAPLGMGVKGIKHENKTLAEKGIKNTRWGYGRGKFTPEAAKEYMTEKELAKAKMAEAIMEKKALVVVRTSGPSLDPEIGARQGALGGKILGGAVGGIYGTAAGAGLGAGLAGVRKGGLKGALIGGGLGTAAGLLGGHYAGKALGRKGSEHERARVMGDMRQKLEMIKQLRAENAAK